MQNIFGNGAIFGIRSLVILAAIAYSIMAGTVGFGQSAGANFRETQLEGVSDPAAVSDEQNNIEIYRSASPGVVLISAASNQRDEWGESEGRSGTGSGVIISAEGYILTNEHVIRGAASLNVNLGGEKVYPARLIGADTDTDLAVIKIDAPGEKLTVIPVGDSAALTVGQKVLAIGNPFGLDRTLTTGIISGLQRPIRARNGRPIEGAIQTDASINPGNSGGPLLDKYGRMVGVNSQILSPSGGSSGIGFAIPASIVRRIVPQLIQNGRVARAQLGVGTKSVSELMQQGLRLPVESGLLVVSIEPGSAAAKAGLRPIRQGYDGMVSLGDVITAVDGAEIRTMDELYRVMDKRRIGDTVQIDVWREGQMARISVKLDDLAR